MNFIKSNFLSLILLLLMCVINFIYYGDLPDQIASEYTMDGEATSTVSKQIMIVIVPVSYLAFILVTNLIIAMSPQKFSMPRSKQTMHRILFAVGILMVAVHCVLLFADGNMDFFTEFFTYGMALFLIVAGNVTGKMERNFFIGIRTPWTISTEENWRVTHRLGGRLMVLVGFALLLLTPFYRNIILMALLAGSTIVIPAIYSFVYFAKNERNEDSNSAAL